MTEKSIEELQRDMLALELTIRSVQLEQLQATVQGADAPTKGFADGGAAEESARAKEAAARTAAVAGNLGDITKEVGKVKGGALTLPEKSVLRQSEIASAALSVAAGSAAKAIGDAVGWKDTVLVTDRIDQMDSVLVGRAFRKGMQALTKEAEAVLGKHRELAGQTITDEEEPSETAAPGTILGAVTALAVAGLNLLSVDTSVEGSTHVADALETHVAVMQGLLPKVAVRHGSINLPNDENEVLKEFAALLPLAARLDAKAVRSADALKALGEGADAAEVATLTAAKARAEVLAEAIRAFATTATTHDAEGCSPLLTAARAHELTEGSEPVPVAVVLPARIDTHQITLKRRILASKVIVTASATIDVIVLDAPSGRIIAAGSHNASRSFQIRFPMWWSPFSRMARERPDLVGLPVYTPLPAWPLTQPGSEALLG